ncbi:MULTISPECIES: YeeE/YedE family protein [Rhodopseudomonas]|uniref:Lipocalin n=1 Tax=Rhodopseudomonas palustris TaxID=1076 RepID=A0A0D7F304_RHOPL|nr:MULTISPECIES: YeeE/YedE family protein [Rhodopseudomonas]KIZ47429.1 lipocalin [Rhodopseudomonas palustris]MDF3814382.1 YeeE/YedE family protein [Rhodopseudomonas sp. BAL398]WOK17341.1 YeeE/YedE family protein [Rhodopseudomonas sp. BAL398]
MDLDQLIERFGETNTLTACGLLVGFAFGVCAQRSRFCLRAAVIEFSQGLFGPKVAIWLLTFSAALAATQLAISAGLLDVGEARQLAARGSLSGSIIGGLMFGAGMIMARGCASRLLVLSATGNLRALVSGLVLTIVAQASLRGALSPAREALSELWTVQGGASRNLLSVVHAGPWLGATLGLAGIGWATWLAHRARTGVSAGCNAVGVGLAVAAGWLLTYTLAQHAFTPITIKSVSFTGPSADTLMGLINSPSVPLGFDIGLVPGVFVGALLAALFAGEWRLQGFHDGPSMGRYAAGAFLMGSGGMLAGGCAVGAGVTGGAIFAVTAWLALGSMWVGALVTHQLMDAKLADVTAPALVPEQTGN